MQSSLNYETYTEIFMQEQGWLNGKGRRSKNVFGLQQIRSSDNKIKFDRANTVIVSSVVHKNKLDCVFQKWNVRHCQGNIIFTNSVTLDFAVFKTTTEMMFI